MTSAGKDKIFNKKKYLVKMNNNPVIIGLEGIPFPYPLL